MPELRGKHGDRKVPSGAEYASHLSPVAHPVAGDDVVKAAVIQDDIEPAGGKIQVEGVSLREPRVYPRPAHGLTGLPDRQRFEVQRRHVVAHSGEEDRVAPFAAAEVERPSATPRSQPPEQLRDVWRDALRRPPVMAGHVGLSKELLLLPVDRAHLR